VPGNPAANEGGGYLSQRGFLLEVGECPANGNQRDLGDRQDVFVIRKVLKHSAMDYLTTLQKSSCTISLTDEWITTNEAAQISGYHVEYIRRLVRESQITARK
jgi:hypothetical protein